MGQVALPASPDHRAQAVFPQRVSTQSRRLGMIEWSYPRSIVPTESVEIDQEKIGRSGGSPKKEQESIALSLIFNSRTDEKGTGLGRGLWIVRGT